MGNGKVSGAKRKENHLSLRAKKNSGMGDFNCNLISGTDPGRRGIKRNCQTRRNQGSIE